MRIDGWGMMTSPIRVQCIQSVKRAHNKYETYSRLFPEPTMRYYSVQHIFRGGLNNGNTKNLRNRICVGYIERNSAGNTECSSVVYTLQCSRQCISDWSDRQSVWKNRKMGDLSVFERGQVVGARLPWVTVTKTGTLLGVSRATVSKVMSAYTNHGKTTSAKRNGGRKSTLTEKGNVVHWEGLFRKITQLLQQNWMFILRTMFPQKLFDVSIRNPASSVGLQLLNLWLLKIMLRFVNDGATTIKSGHQTSGNVWHGQMSHPSRCSLHQEEFTLGEAPRKPTVRNAWFQRWNTEEVLWWYGQ
jgi:hypothetical protein